MKQKLRLVIGLFIIIGTILIAGCVQQNKSMKESPNKSTESEIATLPTDKESCGAQGGRWSQHFLRPVESCILPTADAGKSCTNSSQCESDCIALKKEDRQGKCYEWDPLPGGCYYFVEDGVTNWLCKD